MQFTAIFISRHLFFNGYLLPETFYVFHPIKYQQVLISGKLYLCILKYNQQDATLHNLFISVKCSTCFRRFLHPSSGAQNCIYSIGYFVKPLLLPATVVAGSSKGLTKYPMLYIQFWAPDDERRNRLKHVEHFTEINKLYNVASCWLYLKIRLRCTDPWTSDCRDSDQILNIRNLYPNRAHSGQ